MLQHIFENILAPVLFFGALLAGLVLYLYAIVHLHRNKRLSISEQRFWFNIVWALPVIGSCFYLRSMSPRRRKAGSGKLPA